MAGKLIKFFKKYDGEIGIVVLLLIIFLGISRGVIYSARINDSSELTYGFIYNETQDHFSYSFMIENKRYEGNLNNNHQKIYQVSDTLIIQYYTADPLYHIIHSKKGMININQIEKKKVRFWNAW